MVEVRILGPFEAYVDGSPVDLGRRPAVVLVLLAAHAGHTVSRQRLVEALWEGDPPATARAQVTIHISTLRKAVGDPRAIETTRSGYRLSAERVRTDAHDTERLIARARENADPQLFEEAAARWRGPVLADLPGAEVATLAHRLEELRLTVLEEWAALTPDAPPELVRQLTDALATNPLRETLRARLMEKLWQNGANVEALAHYRDGRQVLADELGVEPNAELRDLHDRILRSESPSPATARHEPRVRPAQLPPVISAFTGRTAELAALDRLVTDGGDHLGIGVISGTAGVGKTMLAVCWAHRVSVHFPDGQLFADLRGYDERARPVTADEVLERFLAALGMPSDLIPADHEQRAALYRSILRERRLLVLLDNAASTEQLRDLLPGSPGCVVVVTARRRLDDLVVRHGATPLSVEPFDASESSDLLTRVLGTTRVTGEPAAAARLAELCGGLPLALRIAAARLAARPALSVARLVGKMTDEHDRLDALSGEELQIRNTFDVSYRHLGKRAAAAFRRLGVVDAPAGVPGWLLGALLDEPDLDEAEGLLEELAGAQLVQTLGIDEAGQPRYRLHDLVRLYARERAASDEGDETTNAALARAFGALLALTERAGLSFRGKGGLEEVHGDFPRWLPDRAATLLTDPLAWLDAERLTIGAAVRQAAAAGWSELCWDLAVTSSILHRRRGYLDDQQAKYELARELCRGIGDHRGEAALLLMHNDLHVRRGEIADAANATSRAASLFGQTGDERAAALARTEYAIVKRVQGECEPALSACAEAAAYFTKAGDLASAAYVSCIVGTAHLVRNRPVEAEQAVEKGLALVPPDAREVELHLRQTLAEAHLAQGRGEEAATALETLLYTARERGDRRMEVQTLLLVGEARLATSDHAHGMAALQEALDRARRLGDRLLEGRGLLATGRADPARHADRLHAAAAIFERQGHRVWHAEALDALAAVGAVAG